MRSPATTSQTSIWYQKNLETPGNDALASGIIALLRLYVAGFAWSWGPLGWLVPTEIQPLETRAAGTGINTFFNFIFTFFIGQLFLMLPARRPCHAPSHQASPEVPYHDAATQPVPADDSLAQLLKRHTLRLRDAQDDKKGHQQHEAAKEEEGAAVEQVQVNKVNLRLTRSNTVHQDDGYKHALNAYCIECMFVAIILMDRVCPCQPPVATMDSSAEIVLSLPTSSPWSRAQQAPASTPSSTSCDWSAWAARQCKGCGICVCMQPAFLFENRGAGSSSRSWTRRMQTC